MIDPRLHDVIETLYPDNQTGLAAGTQGTVVAAYPGGSFEVEFTDDQGVTLVSKALRQEEFIVVWQAATGRPVSLADQVAQLVSLLPEAAGAEVLDFARFVSWQRLKQSERIAVPSD